MGIINRGTGNPNYQHGLSKHPLHKTWRSMKDRCYNKNKPDYVYYGERGIIVGDEWIHNFEAFYDWSINNGYRTGLEIDRINNNLGYFSWNCRWGTHSDNIFNCRHLRSSNTSGYKGVSFWNDKWSCRCNFNNKTHFIGYFFNKEEAALAYNDFVIEHKINTSLNLIKEHCI